MNAISPWRIWSAEECMLAGKRILVVEDEEMLALTLQTMLEDAGADVLGPAQTLEAAKQLAQRQFLSAAILDITVNGERVWPLEALLKARAIPVLFYTGWHVPDTFVDERPDSIIVAKPASNIVLIKALQKLTCREDTTRRCQTKPA